MTNTLNTSPSLSCKFRHDGSHFYAIQKTTSLNAGKERSRVEIPFGETIEKHYRAALKNIKKKKIAVRQDIVPYIDRNLREEIGDKVTREEVEYAAVRLKHNYNNRKKTFENKVYLNLDKFNFFVTVTYDNKKYSSEDLFRKRLTKLWRNLSVNHGWRQIGVFEHGEQGERLHYHAIVFIPKDGVVGNFVPERHYSTKRRKWEYLCTLDYFTKRFGKNEFAPLDEALSRGDCSIDYLCKYAEKSGERFIYSRGIKGDFAQSITPQEILALYNDYVEHLVVCDESIKIDFFMGSMKEDPYRLDVPSLIRDNKLWEKVFPPIPA